MATGTATDMDTVMDMDTGTGRGGMAITMGKTDHPEKHEGSCCNDCSAWLTARFEAGRRSFDSDFTIHSDF